MQQKKELQIIDSQLFLLLVNYAYRQVYELTLQLSLKFNSLLICQSLRGDNLGYKSTLFCHLSDVRCLPKATVQSTDFFLIKYANH